MWVWVWCVGVFHSQEKRNRRKGGGRESRREGGGEGKGGEGGAIGGEGGGMGSQQQVAASFCTSFARSSFLPSPFSLAKINAPALWILHRTLLLGPYSVCVCVYVFARVTMGAAFISTEESLQLRKTKIYLACISGGILINSL